MSGSLPTTHTSTINIITKDNIKQEDVIMDSPRHQQIICPSNSNATLQQISSQIITATNQQQQQQHQITNGSIISTTAQPEQIQVSVNPENSMMIVDTSNSKDEKISLTTQTINSDGTMTISRPSSHHTIQTTEHIIKEEKPFANCKIPPHQQIHTGTTHYISSDNKMHVPHILDVRNADGSILKLQAPNDQEIGKSTLGVEMYKVNIEDISQFLTYHEVFGKLHGDVINHQISSHTTTNPTSIITNVSGITTSTNPSTVISNIVNTSCINSSTTTETSAAGTTVVTGPGELLMPKVETITQIPEMSTNVVDATTTITTANPHIVSGDENAAAGITVTPATHTCDICGKMFQFRYQLIVHRRYHSERKPFNCQVCGQGFTSSQDLTRHGKIHIGCPMFTCTVCFHVFANDASLERHMKRHSTDKPFACTICQKTFARKEHLDNHFRSHTGETPFRCQFCAKTFTRKEHMVNHVRKHTGETPHRCDICKKSFTRKEHYVNHYMWHTGERFLFYKY